MSATETKYRTITLTDRSPVRIVESEWPVIARGDGDSYGGSDYSRYQQAQSQGELDEYTLRVRQHQDGRTIVYAVLDGASAWTGTESRREGELLPTYAGRHDRAALGPQPLSAIAATIRAVGERCGLPDRVIRACIADLPAEVI